MNFKEELHRIILFICSRIANGKSIPYNLVFLKSAVCDISHSGTGEETPILIA